MQIILLCLKNLRQILNQLTFKIGDRVRIIKYKNIFNKGYIGNYILKFSMRVTEKRILLIL